jgi:hypothetical protein
MNIRQEPTGISFKPWLYIMLALVVAGPFLSSLGQRWGILLLGTAGFVPITFQLFTGRALDSSGLARCSRTEEPLRYWSKLLVGLFLACFWSYGAYRVYLRGA